mmetsp:Transcript_40265/g.76983  ORF Transcript_40265/g.76983 Transcript_40265/m.76983 type:complete len:212 (-) Transcript_40265:181-816(-)
MLLIGRKLLQSLKSHGLHALTVAGAVLPLEVRLGSQHVVHGVGVVRLRWRQALFSFQAVPERGLSFHVVHFKRAQEHNQARLRLCKLVVQLGLGVVDEVPDAPAFAVVHARALVHHRASPPVGGDEVGVHVLQVPHHLQPRADVQLGQQAPQRQHVRRVPRVRNGISGGVRGWDGRHRFCLGNDAVVVAVNTGGRPRTFAARFCIFCFLFQ